MHKQIKSFCIIPARKGSKRIKNKNIKNFYGKPIIAYSIEAAIKSKCFNKVIVSTDCLKIAKVAKKYGAEVPFIRPKYLSGDHVQTAPVIEHSIKELTKMDNKPDFICIITATAPMIDYHKIKKGFELLKKSKDEFVVSVTSFAYPIQRALALNKNGNIFMINKKNYNKRSQDLMECYHDAGQFYWGKADSFKKDKKILTSKSKPIFLERNKVMDIDTIQDWEFAKILYKI
jgi:pseudaminic acid cytidylyltransferase